MGVERGWCWCGVCVHVVGFPDFRSSCGSLGIVGSHMLNGKFLLLGCGCVLFENCIVDASIFCSFCCGFFVDKLLRAIGGCLGIKSR